MMLLDTCFLIDLQRERKRRTRGPAQVFLAGLQGGVLAYGVIAYMEFLEGYTDEGRDASDRFLRPYKCILPDAETAWQTSRIERELRSRGIPIGDHAAWIAATALQHRLTLLTRNQEHSGAFRAWRWLDTERWLGASRSRRRLLGGGGFRPPLGGRIPHLLFLRQLRDALTVTEPGNGVLTEPAFDVYISFVCHTMKNWKR